MVNEKLYLSSLINNECPNNKELKTLFNSIIERVKYVSYKDLVYDKKQSKIKSGDNKCSVFLLPKDIHDDIIKINAEDKFNKKLTDYPYGVDTEKSSCFHRTHMDAISKHLKGLGLGYKLYKATAMRLGYISSSTDASVEAKYVWQYLAKDNDFYTILTDYNVLIINKKLPKNEIEDIFFRFLKDKLDIKKQVFHKDIFRSLKLTHILHVDNELCELLKEYKIERLNVAYVEKYIKMYNRQYIEIDKKVKKPTIGQKVVTKNSKSIFKIDRIYKNADKNYNIFNNEGYEQLSRSEFLVIDERVPRKSKKINTEDIFNHLYINPFTFNKKGYKEYAQRTIFNINEICEYNDEISFQTNNGNKINLFSDEEHYLKFNKIDINKDNIKKGYTYFVEFDYMTYSTNVVEFKPNGRVCLEFYNPNSWGGAFTEVLSLDGSENIIFYNKIIQNHSSFIKENKKEISLLEDDMFKLMKSEHKSK